MEAQRTSRYASLFPAMLNIITEKRIALSAKSLVKSLIAAACLCLSNLNCAQELELYQQTDLTQDAQYFIDVKQLWDIQRIRAHDVEIPWKRIAEQQKFHSEKAHPLWLKANLTSRANFHEPWIINLNLPEIDHITFFVFINEQLKDTVTMGNQLPFNARPISNKHFLYRLQLNAQDKLQLYVRIHSSNTITLPLKITPLNDYLKQYSQKNFISNVLYGVLLIMALYNLLTGLVVRDHQYGFFFAWAVSSFFLAVTLSGDGFQLFWPNRPELNQVALALAICIYGFVYLLFFQHYLKALNNRHWVERSRYFVWGIFTFIGLLAIATQNANLAMWASLFVGLTSTALLLLLLYVLVKKRESILLITLGCVFSLITSFALFGRIALWPMDLALLEITVEFTMACSLVCTSLAMAQNIEVERKRRLAVEKTASQLTLQAQSHIAAYHSLFESTPIGIFRFADDGSIQITNPAFRAMYPNEVNFNNVIGLVFKSAEHFLKSLQSVSQNQELHSESIADEENPSGARWLSLSIIPIKPSAGLSDTDSQYYEGQLKDITKETLAGLENEAQEKQKAEMISRLVSGVAHEINTPIGTNITALSLLDEELKALRQLYDSAHMTRDNLVGFFSTCHNVSEILTLNQRRITALIKKFKDVSVTRLSMSKASFDLVSVIRQVSDSYTTDVAKLTLDLPDTPYWVNSFEQAYTEIIAQLVSNSCKFSDKDQCEIIISLNIDAVPAVFSYRDNGPGMDEKVIRNHAFEPFYTTRPGDPECTGLGMFAISNMCKQLLKTKPRLLAGPGFGLSFAIHDERISEPQR